jgi:metal-responsive CopG/Arc/MetJ family transcriptional regulator
MSELARTGLSIERELLARFDRNIAKKGYKNRSEAVRDLIRDTRSPKKPTRTKSSSEPSRSSTTIIAPT